MPKETLEEAVEDGVSPGLPVIDETEKPEFEGEHALLNAIRELIGTTKDLSSHVSKLNSPAAEGGERVDNGAPDVGSDDESPLAKTAWVHRRIV